MKTIKVSIPKEGQHPELDAAHTRLLDLAFEDWTVRRNHSESGVPDKIFFQETRHILTNIVKLYIEFLNIEGSDITTGELQNRRAVFDKKVKRFIGNVRWLRGKRVEWLFTHLQLRIALDRYIERLKVPTDPEFINIRRRFRDQGLLTHVFEKASLKDVLLAIKEKASVEGVNITAKIMDPKFRFLTTDSPASSSETSEAIASAVEIAIANNFDIRQKGVARLKDNADDFARKMYGTITDLQNEEKISSFRETVKVLNERKVPSYRGGQWHLNTLQQLHKRWKELEIIQDDPGMPS